MRRKLGKKNTILFVLFSFLIIILIIIFYFGIRLFMSIGNKEFEVDYGSYVYDKDYNFITVMENGKIKKGYNGNYFLTMTNNRKDYKYDLGTTAVVFKNSDYKMYTFGKLYQILLSGNVVQMNGKLEIIRDNGPYIYKLADRKYLIVDKSIEASDKSFTTNNYLIVDIDKQGNATFANNELSEKTINPLILNCSNFKFDIANEKIVISSKEIDLKNVIGSSNLYVAKTDKDGIVEEVSQEEINESKKNEKDNTADYYASYFKTIVNSFNNLTNSVINNNSKLESKQEINMDLTRWLSLSNVESSVNTITLDYTVFDPNNEYSTVFVLIANEEWNKERRIELTKENKNYIIRDLKPDNEYTITLGYSLNQSPSQEVYDDVLKVKTLSPSYKLKVTKISGDKIYFNFKMDNEYQIESGKIKLYSDDNLLSSLDIDTQKASSDDGWTSNFVIQNIGKVVLLKLEDTIYKGDFVNMEVNCKYIN